LIPREGIFAHWPNRITLVRFIGSLLLFGILHIWGMWTDNEGLVGGKLVKLAAVRDLVHEGVRAIEVTLEKLSGEDLAALETDLDRREVQRLQSILQTLESREAKGLAARMRTYLQEEYQVSPGSGDPQ